MYASLSLELFMHPLLVLFTWQKHFRKKNLFILLESISGHAMESAKKGDESNLIVTCKFIPESLNQDPHWIN